MYREEEFLECASHAIRLANVLFMTVTLPNPPALRAAPFTKGGFWVPSFSKGGTGRISSAVSLEFQSTAGALDLFSPAPLWEREMILSGVPGCCFAEQ